MQKRHQNKNDYFHEQIIYAREFILPYIERNIQVGTRTKILEVGCGEGGNLVTFLERDCHVTGIDISKGRIALAEKFLNDYKNGRELKLIAQDIYLSEDILNEPFDVIFMRDVIEHIHDQDKFMGFIRQFLKPDGIFFLAFPPWQNPFGGHQQICRNKILCKLPYFHLLPKGIYKLILKIGGEDELKIKELLDIKDTGISIERFKRILIKQGYRIASETHYLINPNYQIKFGLKPRKQICFISAIPILRDFLTTAVYYNVRLRDKT